MAHGCQQSRFLITTSQILMIHTRTKQVKGWHTHAAQRGELLHNQLTQLIKTISPVLLISDTIIIQSIKHVIDESASIG